MRWQGRRQSENIEDRRDDPGMGGLGGAGPRIGIGLPGSGGRGGGLGIGAIVVILIIGWLLGINPFSLIGGLESGGGGGPVVVPQQQEAGKAGTPSDEGGQFVATVLADTEDTWTRIFADNGRTYQPPTLVLFRGQTLSGCGFASAASGPFYCPNDQKVYIDLAFYDELKDRFGAPGDFAQAYVVAHEIGHHVQNQLGILPKVNAMRERSSEAESNELSVRTELQADCFAGIWAKQADERGIVEAGDIDEALNAATQIGDDTLQKQAQGYVVPESFTHGSAAQRSRWFKQGYTQGSLKACDTFSASAV
jgi:predicted metalloprotease